MNTNKKCYFFIIYDFKFEKYIYLIVTIILLFCFLLFKCYNMIECFYDGESTKWKIITK